MARYMYDRRRGGLYLLEGFQGEVSRDDAQAIALLELNDTLRSIADALHRLGKSDEERVPSRRAIEIVEDSLGEQFAADKVVLNSQA